MLDTDRRFARFEEGLEVIIRLLRNKEPVSFDGEFYRLHDAVLMPSSTITSGLPIVIGGNGPNRTLPLVARYADEWNAVFVPAKRFVELSTRLDDLLRAAARTRRSSASWAASRTSDSALAVLSSAPRLRSSNSSAR